MWGFLEVPSECPGSWLLTNYGKWSHWRGNNLLLSGVARDNLRLPERRLLHNFFFPYFAIANLFFPQNTCHMFCRASIRLWACNWNVLVHGRPPTLPPHAHLKDKKWTSVTSYYPCQGHFGNACTAKDLWIWAVVIWLLVLPASPCTYRLFLECQLCVLPSILVGCSWACKWQLLLLNDIWWWEVVMESVGNVTFEAHFSTECLAPPACLSWTSHLHCALLVACHPRSPGTEVVSLLEKQ